MTPILFLLILFAAIAFVGVVFYLCAVSKDAGLPAPVVSLPMPPQRPAPDPARDRVYCRCGHSNHVQSRHCVACEGSLALAPYPSPPHPHETAKAYAMRCGPILVTEPDRHFACP